MSAEAGETGGVKAGVLAAAGIVLFALLLHGDEVFGGRVFYTEDVRAVFGPSRFLVEHSLSSGEIPYWNPYLFSGAPFLANPENAIFYPLTAIFLIFPLVTALKVSLILHTVLAAGFACLCFRKVFRVGMLPAFLGGITFAFSSYYAHHVVHHRDVVAVPWIPLALFLLDRALTLRSRRSLACAVGTGLVLAMQLFGGATQTSVLTFSLLAAWAGWRILGDLLRRDVGAAGRSLGFTVLALAIGAGVAAVQVLPSMTLVGESFRAGGVSWKFASYLSIPPPQAGATLIFPHLFGRWGVDWWGLWTMHETILYVGILPLLLSVAAVLGRKQLRGVWFLLALGLVSLLLCFGHWTPLYRLLYEFVPGYDMFRVPARFTLLFCFAVSGLTAAGAHAVFSGKLDPRRAGRVLRILFVLLGGLAAAGTVAVVAAPRACAGAALALVRLVKGKEYLVKVNTDLSGSIRRVFDRLAEAFTEDTVWQAGSAALVVLSAFVILHALRRRCGGRLAVTAVLLADLAFFSLGAPYRQTVPDEDVNRETPVTAFLKRNLGVDERVDERESDTIRWNRNLPYLIRGVDGRNLGIYPVVRYAKFLENLDHDHPRLFDMLRVRYFVTGPGGRPPEGYPVVFEHEGERVAENTDVMPPAWFPAIVSDMPSREVAARVADPAFEPLGEAFVTLGEPIPGGSGSAELVSFAAHEVRYRVKAEREGLLVTSERWYPGWRVEIDGDRPRWDGPVNGILRGAVVPEGEHEVVFRYAERGFPTALGVTALTLALALIAVLLGLARAGGVRDAGGGA